MSRAAFERMVAEALAAVPARFARHLDTVQVVVEPDLSPRQRREMDLPRGESLYGLYEGLTLPERMAAPDAAVLPSVVTIFSDPLSEDFPNPEELKDEVRRTVLHELAHHFGIEDDRLEELGAY